MNRQQLIEQIEATGSFLCVGLDPDLNKIPERFHAMEHPVLEFCKWIVDETAEYCVAYKPNAAFFEVLGPKGFEYLKALAAYIPDNRFKLIDAKRGDIGNTSEMYAKAFLEEMAYDAITLSPYMGVDSVAPYLKFDGKWAVILAATSNPGAEDFQFNGNPRLFEQVLGKSAEWGSTDNIMYVVGATRPEVFEQVRTIVPDHFLLVPGVGAQGGSLEEVYRYGRSENVGLLVNSSRGIIYADDPGQAARSIANNMRDLMSE